MAASKIELELKLDAALLEDRKADTEIVTCLLPAPLSAAGDLLAAMRPRLERLVLRAPVLGAKLRGTVIRFTAFDRDGSSREYTGRLEAGRLAGESQVGIGGRPLAWSAKREP